MEYMYMVNKSVNSVQDKKYNSVILYCHLQCSNCLRHFRSQTRRLFMMWPEYAPMYKKSISILNLIWNYNETNFDLQLIFKYKCGLLWVCIWCFRVKFHSRRYFLNKVLNVQYFTWYSWFTGIHILIVYFLSTACF